MLSLKLEIHHHRQAATVGGYKALPCSAFSAETQRAVAGHFYTISATQVHLRALLEYKTTLISVKFLGRLFQKIFKVTFWSLGRLRRLEQVVRPRFQK